MTALRVFIYIILFGFIGVTLSLLSIVLLPLAIIVLVGTVCYVLFRIITHEDKDPPM